MKKIVTSLYIAICLIVAALPAHAEQYKLTIEECQDRAIEENRDVAVAAARLKELEGLVGEARSSALPQLVGSGGYTRTFKKPEITISGQTFQMGNNNLYQGGAQFNQLLWDGGRVLNAIRAARAELEGSARGIDNAKREIRYLVSQNFYGILYAEKIISVLEEQLKQLKFHLGAIGQRYKKGVDSDYTLMRQEVEVSNVEPELIDARRNREFLSNSLKVLLAIPMNDDFLPNGVLRYSPQQTMSVEELEERAIANRPDLALNKLHEKALKEAIDIEKAGYWPTLNLSANLQWQGMTDNWRLHANDHTVSVNTAFALSWPIFDGLKTHSRVKQARAKHFQQQLSNMQLEDNVVKEVRDAREALIKAREALHSQTKSYELARRATEIAGRRFESGLMSQLELNDTIYSQSRANQLFLKAVYDCITAEALVEKVTGGVK